MPTPLLIHIGYHKTATSWMQVRLFQPEHGYRRVSTHKEVFEHIVKPHGLSFNPALMRARIAKHIDDLNPGEAPVISSEILSGHPFFGGRESDIYAERLAQIAPDARILITIRDQLRILPSVYSQYVLRGGTLPYNRFFEGVDEPGYFGFSPDHFEYDRLLAHYQRLFGREQVLVVTQESLKSAHDATMRTLAAFSGNTLFRPLPEDARRTVGESYPEYSHAVLRRINHVQSSTLTPNPVVRLGTTPFGLFKLAGFALKRPPFSSLLGGRKPVSRYVQARYSGHFAASNARLLQLAAHPLDLSGYDLGEAQPR